jgi:hypothetical protein
VKHLHGNMLSRWTDFLTTDGEKNRDRDAEFEPAPVSREEVLRQWEEGWQTVFAAIHGLSESDLGAEVKIRGQALNVVDAIHRQLSHYSYHVGQMVFLARMRVGRDWQSLSIPRGKSGEYRPAKRD